MLSKKANGLKTARVVKLIFHTVLWGGKNTHKHTRWNIEAGDTGGLGGRGGWVGGSDVHVVCIVIKEATHAHAVKEGVGGLGRGLKTLHVQCIIES